jgi:sugar phosphate isomerase/epimerase
MAKLGFIHYNWPGFSFDEFLRFAQDTGAQYVELQLTDVCEGDNFDPERAAQVRGQVESYGLKVSALAARNDFLQSDPDAVAFQVDRMRRVGLLAQILCDEPILRSEGGAPKDDVPRELWGDALYECFARCTDWADELGVTLAIDNHGIVTNDGDLLIALLKRLNHPRIGSNLDTMNFRWADNSIENCNRFYAELAPFVKHTHLKDGSGAFKEYRGAALGEGEIDLQHALTCLKNANYNGVYLAEYEGKETEGAVGYRKCIEWMKANIA